LAAFVTGFDFGFSQTLAVVFGAVQTGISKDGRTDHVVPCGEGQLGWGN
jgi:hypothetical protein